MPHLAKTIEGNNILTYCGKYMDRQVLGRRIHGRPPAVLYERWQTNTVYDQVKISYWLLQVCEKCLEDPEAVILLNSMTKKVLMTRELIHVTQGTEGIKIASLCGNIKSIKEYLKADEGFVPIDEYMNFFKDFYRSRICNTCSKHPVVQMNVLAHTELG